MIIMLAVLLGAAPQTQAAMNPQASADYRRADAALNTAYRAAMAEAKSDPGEAAALLAAQRAWLQFRDAECVRRSYGSRGGTMHSMDEIGCRTEITRLRTRQLKGDPR